MDRCIYILKWTCLIILIHAAIVFDSFAADYSKVGAQLRILMKTHERQLKILEVSEGMSVEAKAISEPTINALIIFEDNKAELQNLGATVRSKIRNIYSISIPINKIETLSDHNKVKFIEGPRRLFRKLDDSRIEAEVNHVHSGNPAYDGTGVIVGIIDTGIDWLHDDFKDSSGKTRIFIYLPLLPVRRIKK